MRMDAAIARLAVRALGGKMGDYMPWPVEQSSQLPADGEALLKFVSGMKFKKRKRA